MEYGEAISTGAFQHATSIARELMDEHSEGAAAEAVARAFCVCVTDREDGAERRFSDVHRSLIEEVARRIGCRDGLAREQTS